MKQLSNNIKPVTFFETFKSITTKKQACKVCHSLSNTDKMPCKSYGLPAPECNVGSKLNKIAGTVCEGCYALKGQYRFGNVLAAQYKRLASIVHPGWVDTMVVMLGNDKLFRWHDAGDIQSLGHLERIVEIVRATPHCNHWLPTKEKKVIRAYVRKNGSFPGNMIVRLSAPMVGEREILTGILANEDNIQVSSVNNPEGTLCEAYRTFKNGTQLSQTDYEALPRKHGLDIGHCGDCRNCWDPSVSDVSYKLH